MKTTIERVFETLNKVELKAEKVELSVANDIKKGLSKAEKLFSSLDKVEQKMEAVFKKYVQQRDGLTSLAKKASDEANVFKSALNDANRLAKELGVKVNSIDGYDKLENLTERVKNYSKNIQNLYPRVD